MAAQAFSRRGRIVLGSVVGAMILSLVAVTAFGGSVAAKGRQHGHGQQASRDSRDQQVHAPARAAGKSNKGKKRKRRGAAPGAGSAPAAGSLTGGASSGGTQGAAAGLATSTLMTLVFLPSAYVLVENFSRTARKAWRKGSLRRR